MGNFNRSFSRDGRPGSGRTFNRGGGDREMHKTTCSNCGKECSVPFKPTRSKPVFCSECFQRNGGETRRSNDRDYAGRRPSFERPQYNDRPQNFERPRENTRPQENNDQFASLNAKLDRIITLLTPKPEFNNKGATAEISTKSEDAPKADKKPKAPRKTKAAVEASE